MAASSKGRRKNRPKSTVAVAAKSKSSPTQKRRSVSSQVKGPMLFERKNYLLLGVAIALLIVGYAAMAMDNQVRSFISLYLSPIILMAGYLLVIFAIFYRPKDKSAHSDSSKTDLVNEVSEG